MTDKLDVSIWLIIDSDGDYAVGTTEDEANEVFGDQIGGSLAHRVIKIKAKVTPPAVEEVEFNIPDTAGTTQVEVEVVE